MGLGLPEESILAAVTLVLISKTSSGDRVTWNWAKRNQ